MDIFRKMFGISKGKPPTTEESMTLHEVESAISLQARSDDSGSCYMVNPSSSLETSTFVPRLEEYDCYRHFLNDQTDDTHIEEELTRLNDDGWNNLEAFLRPVGEQRVTIVHLAAYAGRIDVLERAVGLYAVEPTVFTTGTDGGMSDPWLATDELGRCALHYAASENQKDVVTWILDKWRSDHFTRHPQISLKDVFGRTPLHDAVGRLNLDVVQLLVEAGAAVEDSDEPKLPAFLPVKEDLLFSWTFSADKASQLYSDIVKYLLTKGTNANGRLTIDINLGHPKTGWTMLHHAISLKSHRTVKYLLRRGADPNLNATDRQTADQRGDCGWFDKLRKCLRRSQSGTPLEHGLSALQYAALESDFKSIRILLNHGGNLAKAYPDSSRTVIDDLRIWSDDVDIVKFLKHLLDAHLRMVPRIGLVIQNYKVLTPKEEPRQTAVISVLIKAMQPQDLHVILKHQLLQAYIGKQWLRFSKLFYSFFMLYTFFVTSLSWYTIRLVNYNSDSACLRRLMLSSGFILFCCHSLEFLADPKWYSKQAETWIFFFSVTLPIIVALHGESVSNSSSSWVLHTLSVVFPLAGVRMTLFLGQVVVLPWGHYALLLSIVLKSVMKVLVVGLFIIAGFSLSFFILFHNNGQFDNPWKAFAKTIVMMTGEYEYGDLLSATAINNSTDKNLDSEDRKYDDLPFVTGRIILIIFLIIAGIVLMNLITGLAVDNVQTLVNEGKLDRLIKQAAFIAHCEQTMLNNSVLSRLCKTWIESTKIKHWEKFFMHKPRPSGISEELWKDVFRVYRRKENH